MPSIVVGAPFDLAELHRQQRCGAVDGLNLRFLIDAQHYGMVRRINKQPDDVPDVFGYRVRD